jgi:hypothetical protein
MQFWKRILSLKIHFTWMFVPTGFLLIFLSFINKITVVSIVYGLILVANIADEVFPKMPIAVVVNSVSEKKDLLTAPPDGYVIVRRMNYGEKLLRSNMATRLLMNTSKDSKDFQGEIDMQTEEVAYWDFANLIVEHNLQDKDGNLLNFKNKTHVKMLDGAVGEEVGRIIDEWNTPESSDEVKNF